MVLPDTPTDSQPIKSGQHPVQNDQLWCMLLHRCEGRMPIKSLEDRMSLGFQFAPNQITNIDLVLYYEDTCHLPVPSAQRIRTIATLIVVYSVQQSRNTQQHAEATTLTNF